MWLSAEGVTPSRAAAALKLRCSATVVKAVRSARSLRRINELRSIPSAINIAFSFVPFLHTSSQGGSLAVIYGPPTDGPQSSRPSAKEGALNDRVTAASPLIVLP